MRAIEKAVRAKIESAGPMPKLEVKLTVADVKEGKLGSVGLNLSDVFNALFGAVVRRLPGRRHRKLLTRALVADHEYREIAKRMETVWCGDGLQAAT